VSGTYPTPEKDTRSKRTAGNGPNGETDELARKAKEQVDGMKLDALRKELHVGAAQAEAGEFVEGGVKSIIVEAKERRG